jgi:hypothetical protein
LSHDEIKIRDRGLAFKAIADICIDRTADFAGHGRDMVRVGELT